MKSLLVLAFFLSISLTQASDQKHENVKVDQEISKVESLELKIASLLKKELAREDLEFVAKIDAKFKLNGLETVLNERSIEKISLSSVSFKGCIAKLEIYQKSIKIPATYSVVKVIPVLTTDVRSGHLVLPKDLILSKLHLSFATVRSGSLVEAKDQIIGMQASQNLKAGMPILSSQVKPFSQVENKSNNEKDSPGILGTLSKWGYQAFGVVLLIFILGGVMGAISH